MRIYTKTGKPSTALAILSDFIATNDEKTTLYRLCVWAPGGRLLVSFFDDIKTPLQLDRILEPLQLWLGSASFVIELNSHRQAVFFLLWKGG